MIARDLEISLGSADQVVWACSFLLGIRFDDQLRRMTLHLDLALEADHPLWTRAAPGEAHCYRAARLEFSDYRIANASPPGLQIDVGPDGEGSLGDLHGIIQKQAGRFLVHGSFQDIVVEASRAALFFEPLPA